MTDTSTVDFTAARVLAVAARDAASRLRDELLRLRGPAAIRESEENQRLSSVAEQCGYLIRECNDAIGAWTTTGDLTPQPKYADATICGDAECKLPQCREYADAVCGGKGRADAAAAETPTDPLADLVRRLAANGFAFYRL